MFENINDKAHHLEIKEPRFKYIFSNLVLLLISFINYWFLKLKNPRHFFVNFEAHLFKFGSKSVNRFYEKIIIDLDLSKSAFSFDYVKSSNRNNFYFSSLFNTIHVPLLLKVLSFFKRKKEDCAIELPDYDQLIEYIRDNNPEFKIGALSLQRVSTICKNVTLHVDFWELILKKVSPKVIFTVCYYIPQNFGLIFAANRNLIPIAEIQHGNQSGYPPYSFRNLPRNGLNTLPKYFVNWDKNSFNQLASELNKTNIHSALEIGNPWIALWGDESWVRKKFQNFNNRFDQSSKPMILYSLVPEAEILPDFIKRTIKETRHQYGWCVRMHPRQVNSLGRIRQIFDSNDLNDVIIDNGSALPLLLKNCDLHITSWSSIVLEAGLYGLVSIVFTEEGAQRYGGFENVKVYDATSLDRSLNDLIISSMNKEKYNSRPIPILNLEKIKDIV